MQSGRPARAEPVSDGRSERRFRQEEQPSDRVLRRQALVGHQVPGWGRGFADLRLLDLFARRASISDVLFRFIKKETLFDQLRFKNGFEND